MDLSLQILGLKQTQLFPSVSSNVTVELHYLLQTLVVSSPLIYWCWLFSYFAIYSTSLFFKMMNTCH